MVDFTKRLKNKSLPKKINPIEIYDSLDRRSETGPLRPSQSLVLEEWFTKYKNRKNNIIKLHTGEGKTLIGLLLLLSKINSGEGPCLYVCPNIYLADQVKNEAKKFGIPVCEIGNKNELPEEFLLGSHILITHVQKVFNGKTIFGLKNQSVDVGAIVLDDSHACIDSIKDSLTIKVKSNHELYSKTMAIFGDDIKEQGEGSFLEIESGDYNTMLPIPYWSWYDKKDDITKAIIESKNDDEIKFSWPVIKDQIGNCQAFISGQFLEISPTLMPIDQFGSFSRAKNRILMSATTQDDSFFIKGLGFDIESVSKPISNPKLKWSGEKMLIIPSLISEELDRDAVINWLAKPNKNRNYGMVFLIPGFRNKAQYEKLDASIATTSNIFNIVKSLKEGNFTKSVVFANRYDGIDLPDNSCRILIIDSKPYFDSLLDRYEEDCRVESDILNIRIAQKVEQGLGRSVRGEKDYSIIVLIGGDLVKFIKNPASNKYFSPQTRKQIEIGIQVASFTTEDSTDETPYHTLANLMKQVLHRDDGWKEYYAEEMNNLNIEGEKKDIYDVIKLEYEAEWQFSIGEYPKACETIQKLCDKFSNFPSERGWYLQQLARYKYRTSKVDANRIQKSAFQSNLHLLKPKEGISYNKIEFVNQSRVERIKSWIRHHQDYQEMMISLEGILQNLSFGMPSEKFESALMEIGEAIGFISQRPDKEIKKGPDNLWCGVENQYFLLECKNEVDETRSEISKYEAGQMNSHSAWFESIYGNAKCKRVIIIPTLKLSYHADFTHDVEVMRKNMLKKLKNNVKGFFKEFGQYDIHSVSDQKIQQLINIHELDIPSLINKYTERYKRMSK
ncbi:DEAD/DEAH box helicase [Proteus mirabilis]|uniref:DEAD/DEAH box helicase n=2 Tax=Morganellaceae TaxID=1903414 RepID=UPI001376BE09|nr:MULTISPECIES: DEAD/DEAH box helicase [Proteus]EKW6534397.1 DEAD/DEAH box helicase family protein [Proteus mirabilis]ELA7642754.1 DEAD/DEAH box helicase family protein [Proteus mirabilis]ELW9234635.1 DEAD/DEAH box helicase family protein [Proteus mirabilis]EMF0796057.1 DEAD/DEAH box helicase family protein [Proteus mirabilis]MBG2931236.1 DEAD/DEAH box helicase family protein [Proteus mirabilis]